MFNWLMFSARVCVCVCVYVCVGGGVLPTSDSNHNEKRKCSENQPLMIDTPFVLFSSPMTRYVYSISFIY